MDSEFYYTPPSDKIFEEVRSKAIELWTKVAEEPTYALEKIGSIDKIKNVGDNFMYIVAMFDIHNQRNLAETLSEEARTAIRDRMIAGGNELYYIAF